MRARSVLALVVGVAVLAGCGGHDRRAASDLVFSGLPSGSYVHAIRPDGRGLSQVALPKTCSPKAFSRDGDVLSCYEWSAPWVDYTVARRDSAWRRVPRPHEWRFPAWVTKGMSYQANFALNAAQWAPTGDRIALVRRPHAPYGDIWFSGTGNLVVADPDGSRRRVVARRAEVPAWSPDGGRLAFVRCRVFEAPPTDYGEDSAKCTLWTVAAEGSASPKELADDVDSPPVWSPDGRSLAFFRMTRPCKAVCEGRIIVVSASDGRGSAVGPELIEPSQLFWLPAHASAVVVANESTADDPRRLQRCADIWNRARMRWPTGVANVRLVHDGCQVTVGETHSHGFLLTGFACSQPVRYSFECPSHGANLATMNPAQRVWNALVDKRGKLRLVKAPAGPRLPLPKAPPYPLLNGYVLPFNSDGTPRRGLTFTKTETGTCVGRGYIKHPDSERCGWQEHSFTYVDNDCFKAPGRPLRVGDVVLCPVGAGSTKFIRLKLSKVNEPLDG
jgi:WD40-like Beta Propeller Repeat